MPQKRYTTKYYLLTSKGIIMSDTKQETMYDYSAFEDTALEAESDVLAKITKHAERMKALDKEIAKSELATKKLVNERKRIAEDLLPDLFNAVGFGQGTTITTRTGLPLKLTKVLHTSIAGAKKPAAITWLDKNGHGGIVKRQVVINFNRDDSTIKDKNGRTKVDRLLRLIGSGWKDHRTDLDVNGASVKALIKRLLEKGEDVPKETFNIHQADVVKITSK